MIHINLLPPEYRKKARTPVKFLMATLASATVASSLLAWFGWLMLGVEAEVNSEVAVLQTEMDGLNPQVKYHKALDAERAVFEAREKTLAGITANRINWTRKLDELVNVINSGGEGVRHFVWLDDFSLAMGTDPKNKGVGTVKAAAKSGSDNFAQMANFLDDLTRSAFMEDFLPPGSPEGQATQIDKDLVPAVVWAFPLNLTLKSAEERSAGKDAATAGESKPKPVGPSKDKKPKESAK
jgi:Tfp pilus assembly protein PilN